MKNSYTVESSVWGQAITLLPANNGIMKVIVSDFDSGATVTVGMAIDEMKEVVTDIQDIIAEDKAQGKMDEAVEEVTTGSKATKESKSQIAKFKHVDDRAY